MPEWVTEVLSTATPYWPAITQVIVIWYLGQFFKKRVWTKKRALGSTLAQLMRDTLPIHPIAAGALWGALYPWLPAVELVTTRGGAINQGLLMGALTMVGHTGLEAVAEARGWTWVLKILRDTVKERETSAPPAP